MSKCIILGKKKEGGKRVVSALGWKVLQEIIRKDTGIWERRATRMTSGLKGEADMYKTPYTEFCVHFPSVCVLNGIGLGRL